MDNTTIVVYKNNFRNLWTYCALCGKHFLPMWKLCPFLDGRIDRAICSECDDAIAARVRRGDPSVVIDIEEDEDSLITD